MPPTQQGLMNLTTTPETVHWPETHYVFIERMGPFEINAPQAWQTLHQILPAVSEHNQITGYFALYKIESQIYRAGVSVSAKPDHLLTSLTKSCRAASMPASRSLARTPIFLQRRDAPSK
jgi:hypothetical protein